MKGKPKRKGPRGNQSRNFKDKDRLTDTGALSKDDRVEQRDRRDYSKSAPNDWNWYAQNIQLLTDYASFPFGVPVGTPLTGLRSRDATINESAVPGVMALYYTPTIGVAQSETDPITIAARNIYSFVRHANSGHTNYDAPDLMLYLLSMDSVYMFHEYMKRALGVLLDYTPTNRYYPRALLIAMGLNPEDFISHIADFRGYINQYAVRVGSMCVPNSMSYMARHTWMTSGLYTDSTSSKAQTYMYVPYSYFKFGLTSGDAPVGQITRVQLFNPQAITAAQFPISSLVTFEQLRTFGDDLFAPIITNEDMNIMSGDILKAFGPEGLVKIHGVLDGYMVLPTYSEEVLSQIENSVILGANPPSVAVQQNTTIGGGYLTAGMGFLSPYSITMSGTVSDQGWDPLSNSFLLNFHHDGVTPAETMVATRLALTCSISMQGASGNKSLIYTLDSCGSEVLTYAGIFYYAMNGSVNTLYSRPLMTCMPDMNGVSGLPYSSGSVAEICALHAQFDWAPRIWRTYYQEAGSMTKAQLPLMDIDNYTILSPNNIKNLHAVALLSEFSVPQMGAFSTKI
nr:capsid protein [Rat picobirnavirus]